MDNCLAHNYADNIKPISKYILRNFLGEYETFIAVRDEDKCPFLKEKGLHPIKFHSLKYYVTAMSSGFFVTNSGGYSYLPLKKMQHVVNTWHGGGAYKKFGMDSYSADDFYARELKLAAQKTTLFLSTCRAATNAFLRRY